MASPANSYPAEPLVNKLPLPDPLLPPDGSARVTTKEAWPAAAAQWKGMITEMLFGGLPEAPDAVTAELVCHSIVRRLEEQPVNLIYRVHCHKNGKTFPFTVRIFTPPGPGPHPAIVNGDGCWWYFSDEIVRSVIRAGCALVVFNRTELAEDAGGINVPERDTYLPKGVAPDPERSRRKGGLYEFFNSTRFSAVSAWAWGFHRCVDLLEQLKFIDTTRIAANGHSRGSKAAMLAALNDSRITLLNENGGCAAGVPVFRWVGYRGEMIDIVCRFPTWFNPDMKEYLGREEALPFDQHCVLASLAPRPVIMTYGLDDRWSNPEGMVLSVQAAKRVYDLFGAGDNLCFHLREGGHSHTLEDWAALLAFIRWKWFGETPAVSFNCHPYTHLPAV